MNQRVRLATVLGLTDLVLIFPSFRSPRPLGEKARVRGLTAHGTLSCILSPQGRGEKEGVLQPRYWCVFPIGSGGMLS
jgi:hypothetical protein